MTVGARPVSCGFENWDELKNEEDFSIWSWHKIQARLLLSSLCRNDTFAPKLSRAHLLLWLAPERTNRQLERQFPFGRQIIGLRTRDSLGLERNSNSVVRPSCALKSGRERTSWAESDLSQVGGENQTTSNRVRRRRTLVVVVAAAAFGGTRASATKSKPDKERQIVAAPNTMALRSGAADRLASEPAHWMRNSSTVASASASAALLSQLCSSQPPQRPPVSRVGRRL